MTSQARVMHREKMTAKIRHQERMSNQVRVMRQERMSSQARVMHQAITIRQAKKSVSNFRKMFPAKSTLTGGNLRLCTLYYKHISNFL